MTQDDLSARVGEELHKRAESVSEDDIGKTIEKEKAAEDMAKGSGILRQYWEDIKTSFALLKDWYIGNYRTIPFHMVASLAVALLYMVSPIDLIPDWIPFGGLIDDALALSMAFAFSRNDLDEYREWSAAKEK